MTILDVNVKVAHLMEAERLRGFMNGSHPIEAATADAVKDTLGIDITPFDVEMDMYSGVGFTMPGHFWSRFRKSRFNHTTKSPDQGALIITRIGMGEYIPRTAIKAVIVDVSKEVLMWARSWDQRTRSMEPLTFQVELPA